MNKVLLSILFLLLLAISGIGLVVAYNAFSSDPQDNVDTVVTFPTAVETSNSTQPTKEEAEAIQSAFFASDEAEGLSLDTIRVVENYAISVWYDENMGGVALYQQTGSGSWELLLSDGGAWTVEDLVILGVPQTIAERLLGVSG